MWREPSCALPHVFFFSFCHLLIFYCFRKNIYIFKNVVLNYMTCVFLSIMLPKALELLWQVASLPLEREKRILYLNHISSTILNVLLYQSFFIAYKLIHCTSSNLNAHEPLPERQFGFYPLICLPFLMSFGQYSGGEIRIHKKHLKKKNKKKKCLYFIILQTL